MTHLPADAPKHDIALSVAVPCHNEEDCLAELHARLTDVCRAEVGQSYELILVNDGSTDSTWQKISDLATTDAHVVGVNLSRNHGHQLALTAGLSLCRGKRVLIIDADLQDPPELLSEMMKIMDSGHDVVFGQRAERDGETLFKRASAQYFYRLLNRLVDIEIPLDTGDFRLMNRKALDILNAMPERIRFIRGMVSWVGLRQTAIRYKRQVRFQGESSYPFKKMLLFAIDAITSFSTAPLRLASHLGILFGLLGCAALIYVFGAWLTGAVVPGWSSLAALILILGSAQLIMLGVFGEYLGRMYIEAKNRPLFIIDEIVTNSSEDHDQNSELGESPVAELQRRLSRGNYA